MNVNKISDAAHALIPWFGIILGLQAVISAYLLDAGVPVKLVNLAFGAIGIIVAIRSKGIDSKNDAAKATAPIPVLPQSLDLPQPEAEVPAA